MNPHVPAPHYIVASVLRGPSSTPKKHQTEEDAMAEAERLALQHQGDQFQVYKSHRFVRARRVDVIGNSESRNADYEHDPFDPECMCDRCIPF